ncbi:MAG: VOC family protein [Chloroflexota bacterium]
MISAIIAVRDVDLSIAFYTEKLGFTSDGSMTSTDGRAIYGNARLGDHIQFMFNGFPDPMLAMGTRGLGVEFHVTLPDDTDIDALYARFQAQDVPIVVRIREEYWGERRFTIADPDGYTLSFVRQIRHACVEEHAEIDELTSASA